MSQKVNKAITDTDIQISKKVLSLMKKQGVSAYHVSKHLAKTMNEDFNNTKAKFSSYLNNHSRWTHAYLVALTYILGVGLNEFLDTDVVSNIRAGLGELGKEQVVNTLVEEYRVHITKLIDKLF